MLLDTPWVSQSPLLARDICLVALQQHLGCTVRTDCPNHHLNAKVKSAPYDLYTIASQDVLNMTPELALIGVLWAWVLGRMATLGPRLDSLHWMPCISASHWYRINAVPAQTPYRYITWGIVLHILCCFIMIAHTSRITYMVACVHACLCVAWVPLFFERALGFRHWPASWWWLRHWPCSVVRWRSRPLYWPPHPQ